MEDFRTTQLNATQFKTSRFKRGVAAQFYTSLTLAILACVPLQLATAQTASLSPTSLTFGNQAVGLTSAIKTVSLTNTGSKTMSVTSIVASAGFAETNTCGAAVAAGKKCMISVTFTPESIGAASGTVSIADNASNSPQIIATTGAGIADVTLSPATLTFASRTVGTSSAPVSVTLTNHLTTALAITGVSTTGDFSQTNTCGSSVPAGKTCTISTTFTPTLVGTRTGTLTVTDGASNSPQTVSLAGTGSTAGLISIAITPANPSVNAGATEQFHATGTFIGGTTYDLTQSVTWSSSKSTVATVSNGTGTQGLASALAPGTSTIKGVFGKISGTTVLTVTAVTLQSITVTPAAPSISLGTGQQFTATGNYSDGSTQNLTGTVIWSSSATNVATISPAGLASSVAAGSSTISATSGSISGSTLLTVTPAALLSIAVTPANASAGVGTVEQYKATGTYSDGSTFDLTTTATWSSSATNIASISSAMGTQGLATAMAVGTTIISAALNGVGSSTGLTVTPAALVSIAVTPAQPSIAAGVTQQFSATGTFTDGSTQDVTMSAVWSSSDTNVATISNTTGQQGLASSLLQGTATITATSGTIAGSATLTVTAATLVSIAVTPANPMLPAGTTQQFTAIGTFTDGTSQNLTTSAIWASSDPTVVTIGNSAGMIGLATAVAQGGVTITATSGTVVGSSGITVTPATIVAIAVTPSSASIADGATQQFDAMGTFSDGSTQDVTGTVYWSTSDGTVATISDSAGTAGLATGVANGSVTVTAASGSVNGTASLTVAASLVSISIAPQNAMIALGTGQQFTATGNYSDGSTQNLTSSASWASDTPSVASISNSGLASAVSMGSANISASLGGISGSTPLTVTGATLVSIAVTPVQPSIAAGVTQQFGAMGTFTDGSTQDVTMRAVWSSLDTNVATISNVTGQEGLASGLLQGTTTITATSGAIAGSATLTVTAATLVSIAMTPANPMVPAGTTQQFTATGTFTDGTSQNLTSSSSWASDTTSVASISNSGLASAVSMGAANISASVGGITGSTLLTVTGVALVSIAVSPANASIAAGTTQQFTAIGTFSDQSAQDLTSVVAWTSSVQSVATISNAMGSNGLAATAGMGTTAVTAASNSISGFASLTVSAASLVSITVTPQSPTIRAAMTQQFTATGTYTDGSMQNITGSVTWASSNTALATISNSSGMQGLATGLSAGTSTISASLGVTGTSVITVVPGIDTLTYSTYLGGTSNDYATSMAVDSAGNVYVTGYTSSTSFPVTPGSFQVTCGGGCSESTADAFVIKFSPLGAVIYSTFIGGSGNDIGNGIAVDAEGNAYVVGQTFSTDFPVTPGAFQAKCGGTCSGGDAFIAKMNATGTALIYSTYLGGKNTDQGNGIVLDAADDAYIIGYSQSTNFPTTPGAYQPTCSCSASSDVIVSELNPTGTALVYSTYLGGSSQDVGYGIVLDPANNAYLTGYTRSTNFPTTPGAFQSARGAGQAAFVTKLNATGSALVYSTYLGGGNNLTTPCEACGTSITVDAAGNAYVVGLTAESNFPTTSGAFQRVLKSTPQGHDAFVTKFDPNGALLLSTYVGGEHDDGATSVALDSNGNIWIKGNTESPDFPVTSGAFQTTLAGQFDAYVAELDPTESTLLYCSYLGGTGNEFGGATLALAIDGEDNVYLSGYTNSTDFPVTNGAFQPGQAGNNDAFVSRFGVAP